MADRGMGYGVKTPPVTRDEARERAAREAAKKENAEKAFDARVAAAKVAVGITDGLPKTVRVGDPTAPREPSLAARVVGAGIVAQAGGAQPKDRAEMVRALLGQPFKAKKRAAPPGEGMAPDEARETLLGLLEQAYERTGDPDAAVAKVRGHAKPTSDLEVELFDEVVNAWLEGEDEFPPLPPEPKPSILDVFTEAHHEVAEAWADESGWDDEDEAA